MQISYYTKYGCSLCDEGLSILRRFPDIDVIIVDVEDDIEKFQSYLLRIPVVSYDNGSRELCWPFDEDDVRKMVSAVTFQGGSD